MRAGPGRPKGSQNKVNAAFKTALLLAFEEIGGVEALAAWAKENPTDFYKICGRLIPHEVSGPDGAPIAVAVVQCMQIGGKEVMF